MKRLFPACGACLVVLLLAGSPLAQGTGIHKLTQQYVPDQWKLYPIHPNPMTPYNATEFSVPIHARLSVDVVAESNEDGNRAFVRHIDEPKMHHSPGVYRIEWWCVCDSLNLPVNGGVYSLIVNAWDETVDTLVFADSIKVLIFEGVWKNLDCDSADFSANVLEGWQVAEDGTFEHTDVHHPYSRLYVSGVKIHVNPDATRADSVVIALADGMNIPVRCTFPCHVRAWICTRDGESACGYRTLRELLPVGQMGSTWPLSLVEGELLLIQDASDWPVVVDGSPCVGKARKRAEQ